MDASVVDETDPTKTDPALDPFNPEKWPTLFSEEFIAKYRGGATRAQSAHHRLGEGGADATQGSRNSRPNFSIVPHLGGFALHGSGHRSFGAHFVPLAMRDRHSSPTAIRSGIGRANTLRLQLACSMWSLETSHCRGEEQLAKLELPSLVIQSLGDTGVFPSDALTDFPGACGHRQDFGIPAPARIISRTLMRTANVADAITEWIRERA